MRIHDSLPMRFFWQAVAHMRIAIATLRHRRGVAERKHGIYAWDFGGERVYSSMGQIAGLMGEYLRGRFGQFYGTDFGGKAVLDVGGFVGDSALHFLKNGASRVVVYEPLDDNVAAAKLNLWRFGRKAVIRKSFICDRDGDGEVRTSALGSTSFGEDSDGADVSQLACMSLGRALDAEYDVAKFDCEGCEYYLADADWEAVGRIPHWIIEFHLKKDRNGAYKAIMERFRSSGFAVERRMQVCDQVEIIHLRKTYGNTGRSA